MNNNQFIFEVESDFGSISSATITSVPIPEPNQAALAIGILAFGMIGLTRRLSR